MSDGSADEDKPNTSAPVEDTIHVLDEFIVDDIQCDLTSEITGTLDNHVGPNTPGPVEYTYLGLDRFLNDPFARRNMMLLIKSHQRNGLPSRGV